MKPRTRSIRIAAILALLVVAALTLAVNGDAVAKVRTPVIDPQDCGTCPPPYVGPNGGICEPLGCVRPGGTCILAGDCF